MVWTADSQHWTVLHGYSTVAAVFVGWGWGWLERGGGAADGKADTFPLPSTATSNTGFKPPLPL